MSRRKSPAHVTFSNDELLCRNCGERYRPAMPCSVSIWSAIVTAWEREHTRCEVLPGSPASRDSDPPGKMTPEEWLASGKVGISSATIWAVMSGRPFPLPFTADTPHDPSDFERCHYLLEKFPVWRSRLSEVGERYTSWAPFVAAWSELEELYREERPAGHAPKLYARIQQLRGTR